MSGLSCVYTMVVCLAAALTGFGQNTQTTTVPPLPLVGPNRPIGVPADYVITPFGYFHPSCVLQLKKGESFQEGGVLRHADGNTETIAPCLYPHYAPPGELAPAGSLEAHKGAAVQKEEAGTTPPPSVNGWIENSHATIATAFGKVVSTWTVPPLPLAQDSQTVYFYPGLEPLSSQPLQILQPILGSGGESWFFVSWDCCRANTAHESTPINVNVGDTVVGTMVMTCAAGTEACPTWNVISEDQTTNESTELSATPNNSQAFNWGFGGVLEAYNILQSPITPPTHRSP